MTQQRAGIEIFKKSLHDFFDSPQLLILSTAATLIFFMISALSTRLVHLADTDVAITLLTAGIAAIVLLTTAALFTIFIRTIQTGQTPSLFSAVTRKTGKVVVILAALLLLSAIVFIIAFTMSFFIGKAFTISLPFAQGLFFIMYLGGLLSVVLFGTYSALFVIIRNESIWMSLRSSIRCTQKNYLVTLSIILTNYVLYELVLLLLPKSIGTMLLSVVLTPLTLVLLTNISLAYHESTQPKR